MWGLYKGPKDPNNRVLGPKHYNIIGIWDQKPYYLGPWTLRVRGTSIKTRSTRILTIGASKILGNPGGTCHLEVHGSK